MGRKDYRQQAQRGPGPKARRQKDPKLPPAVAAATAAEKSQEPARQLGSRQKQRLKRRLEKAATGGSKKCKLEAKLARKKLPQKEADEDLDKVAVEDLEELNDDGSDDDGAGEAAPAALSGRKRLKLDLDDGGGEEGVQETAGATLLDEEDEDFLNDDFPIGEDVESEESEADDSDGDETADKAADDDTAEDEALTAPPAAAEEEQPAPADLSELDGRIDDLLQALGSKGRAGVNRSDCLEKLCGLLCARFSYNAFLMRKLLDLYPKDILDFLQSNEVDRPLTLRVNALKTRRKDLAQALIARGVNLDPFEKWSKVGLVVYDSQVPLGATPEYLAGQYMLQGAASMLPVMALDPRPQEKVLDLCAAPGGKTTYIAELMRNTGLVMANEANRERAKAVVGNAHRHGLNNIVVCVGDGREFARTMHNFDRVLVDAPCTGTGVIAKDPAVKANKEEKDVLKCSHLQKQLLLAGIDAAKVGGTLVYCTCSVLVEENEAVVDYALRRRRVKLVEAGLAIGEAGFRAFRDKRFHPSLALARRITPHQHNMDGFFLAKLVKVAAGAVASADTTDAKVKPATAPVATTGNGK